MQSSEQQRWQAIGHLYKLKEQAETRTNLTLLAIARAMELDVPKRAMRLCHLPTPTLLQLLKGVTKNLSKPGPWCYFRGKDYHDPEFDQDIMGGTEDEF